MMGFSGHKAIEFTIPGTDHKPPITGNGQGLPDAGKGQGLPNTTIITRGETAFLYVYSYHLLFSLSSFSDPSFFR